MLSRFSAKWTICHWSTVHQAPDLEHVSRKSYTSRAGYSSPLCSPNPRVQCKQAPVYSWLDCFCCLPSETYGRNGVTPIFRSFHRTASSTTGGWSRWNILMCFFYIILSTEVSYFGPYGWHFFTRFPFFVYISIFFFCKYTLHVCYVFNVNLTDSFDDRRSQCRFI